MIAAQAFINAHCATLHFDYHLPEQYGLKPEDTDPVVANVKDKAARLVAVWAVQGGKFRISHGGGESTSKGVGEAEGRRALRCKSFSLRCPAAREYVEVLYDLD